MKEYIMSYFDDYIKEIIKYIIEYINPISKNKYQQYITLVKNNNILQNTTAKYFIYQNKIYPETDLKYIRCANLHPDLYETMDLLLASNSDNDYKIHIITSYLQELLFSITELQHLTEALPSAINSIILNKYKPIVLFICGENEKINHTIDIEFIKNKHKKACKYIKEFLTLKLLV